MYQAVRICASFTQAIRPIIVNILNLKNKAKSHHKSICGSTKEKNALLSAPHSLTILLGVEFLTRKSFVISPFV